MVKIKEIKTLERIFEDEKIIFFRKKVFNKSINYHYYKARKFGKKICKSQFLTLPTFKKELKNHIGEDKTIFKKFENYEELKI